MPLDPDCANARSTIIFAQNLPSPVGLPIDVMAFDRAATHKHGSLRFHLWQSPIPSRAFCKVGGSVYVSSPEFLFLQFATWLTFAELVALGNEFCGRYSLRPYPESTVTDLPTTLSSTAKLRAFINASKGIRGCNRAASALRHVVDESGSPAETETEMLLCLPPMLGGYGLDKPIMNKRIDFTAPAQAIANKPFCVGDLCWPDKKVVIEYYSSLHHSGRTEMQADTARMDALTASGYHALAVTSAQAHSTSRFEAIACDAARALGKRLVKKHRGPSQARNELRSSLFAWHYHGGIPKAKQPEDPMRQSAASSSPAGRPGQAAL